MSVANTSEMSEHVTWASILTALALSVIMRQSSGIILTLQTRDCC